MTKPTELRIPRRAFLVSLLSAASAGCGGKGVTKNATEVGKQQAQQTEALAPKAASVPRLEDSGMRPKMIADIRSLVTQPHGMLLCCGPSGSGRTTTLYACLREVDPQKKKILTVEDPIEYHLDNIPQRQIAAESGETFAGSLPSILGQNPDLLMIDELRDLETARIACRAAATGQLVLSSFRADDAYFALFRLLDLGVEPSLVASALSAVLGQRYVRLLCETCKEPYKPKPEFLTKANLPPEKVDVFYRRPQNPQRVCPRCNGTGYVGQTGIFELLIVTEPIREMIRNNPSLSAIKAEARKNGMIYIAEDGLRQVIWGRTSIEALLEALELK